MSKYLARIFSGENAVFLVICMGWAAGLAYAMLESRFLYGDGAYALLKHILAPHRFNDYDPQRTFASLITQAPFLFGQRLGVESVVVFAAMYSFGFFVVPAILLVASLALVRKQPVPFAAIGLAILVYGFGTNFINTEANLFFGFVWFSVSILACNTPAPFLRGFLLPVIAIALLRTYEGMLLVGPILSLWAAIASRRQDDCAERTGLVIAALLYFVGAIIGLGGGSRSERSR